LATSANQLICLVSPLIPTRRKADGDPDADVVKEQRPPMAEKPCDTGNERARRIVGNA
jgi:hypothetical protein